MYTRILSPAYPKYRRLYHMAKRIMDLTICIVAFPIVLPLMAIIAIAIRLDSPGPVLFIQDRIGKGGRHFKMFKFRTMKWNIDTTDHRTFMKAFVKGQIGGASDGTVIFKPIQTSQITRVGRVLRKTSLDELPQIINVLRGEMSLVGPRPNVPWEVEEYRLWHYERLEVLPGITGLAQVRGRSSINFDSIVRCDIQYIDQPSLVTDLAILLKTIGAVITKEGAK